jgi:integrase
MLKENNVREGFLNEEAYLRMRELLPFHHQLLLVMGYHWGMRKGESLALRWDQVDWAMSLVRLNRGQTKGNKARVAPMYGELDGWLKLAFAADRGETIVSWKGSKIGQTKPAWQKARDKAGLEVKVHDLRRTAVRNMVRAGIPDTQARQISGHKTRSVLDRYDIVTERDIQDAGRKMEAYFRAIRTPDSHSEEEETEGTELKSLRFNDLGGADDRT